jgi:hypothetical protein
VTETNADFATHSSRPICAARDESERLGHIGVARGPRLVLHFGLAQCRCNPRASLAPQRDRGRAYAEAWLFNFILKKQDQTMDDEVILPGMNEREIYIRRRVRRMAEFYRHLAYYVVVSVVLFVANYLMLPAKPPSANIWWAFYPIAGWGIGVVIHALTVFSPIGFFSLDWEERKVRELIRRSSETPRK